MEIKLNAIFSLIINKNNNHFNNQTINCIVTFSTSKRCFSIKNFEYAEGPFHFATYNRHVFKFNKI